MTSTEGMKNTDFNVKQSRGMNNINNTDFNMKQSRGGINTKQHLSNL